jgi:prepilin-type N-terminal cleavage/methylation domain-containing protein
MKAKYRRPDGFTLVELLVVIVIIAALAGLSAPVILKQRKAADRTEAINNIKQIGAMLIEFDTDYGNFPDNETAEDVKEATGTDLTFGGSFSNDYFRQMLAGGGGKSEKPFWCKTAQSPKKADDNFATPGKALEAGEVGFSYIMASQTQGQSASGEPSRPVVVTPSYKFQTDWTFDPEPYAGKAVVLRLDNSATAMQIREDNKKVSTNSGKTLGDTGDQTPWGTDMNPILRAPQPRGGGN